MKKYLGLAATTIALTGSTLSAADATFSLAVPHTAYIQFLPTAVTAMTGLNANNPYVPTATGGSSVQQTVPGMTIYLGVMCNTTSGYTVAISSTQATGPLLGRLKTILAGTSYYIPYNATLTLNHGTHATNSTALTLNSNSDADISVTSIADANLPVLNTAPDVWQIALDFRTPDDSGSSLTQSVANDLFRAGTYTDTITATVTVL